MSLICMLLNVFVDVVVTAIQFKTFVITLFFKYVECLKCKKCKTLINLGKGYLLKNYVFEKYVKNSR